MTIQKEGTKVGSISPMWPSDCHVYHQANHPLAQYFAHMLEKETLSKKGLFLLFVS